MSLILFILCVIDFFRISQYCAIFCLKILNRVHSSTHFVKRVVCSQNCLIFVISNINIYDKNLLEGKDLFKLG